jgi:hypothetical protein
MTVFKKFFNLFSYEKTFSFHYTLSAPVSLLVAAYLDCEHYDFIHQSSIEKYNILDHGPTHITWKQTWIIHGFSFGHIYTTRYFSPSVFTTDNYRPFPRWIPNFHHFYKVKSKVQYYSVDENTTLSITEFRIKTFFFPFAIFIPILSYYIKKFKILIDLEDMAILERKKYVFGKLDNLHFTQPDQFFFFRDEYLKFFSAPNASVAVPDKYKNLINSPMTKNLKDLPHRYIHRFMKTSAMAKSYMKYE